MQRRNCLQGLVAATTLAAASPLMAQPAAALATPKRTRLPLESFARRPMMEQVALSPNGQRLAAIINNSNQSLLVTRDCAGANLRTVLSTDNLELMFNWFRWVNDERLVVSLRFPSRREVDYLPTINTMESRLVAINADGSLPINLVKQRAGSTELRWAIAQDNVVDWLPEDGQHILMSLPNSDRSISEYLYKVNIHTAERRFYADGRKNAYDWVTDQSHRARVAMEWESTGDDNSRTLWVCDPDGSNWRVLRRFTPLSPDIMRPLGFGKDRHVLYVSADHQGLRAVQTVDLRDPQLTLRVKLSDPNRDLGGALIHDGSGEAVGIRWSREGDSSASYWDPNYKAWQQSLDEALPDRFNEIGSVSRNQKRYIVHSEKRGEAGSIFLGELGDQPTLALLAHRYPELEDQILARKQSIKLQARDGLELTGYLSLPPGQDGKTALPLVVLPHGGPQSMDGPDFDDWVAFIADRGAAVLQINFRGSTGHGRKFMEAGLRRWGLEMQDDLSDGVAEFVKRGVADPARVAIVGASYGGYAALMGVIKTPTLYRGAFAFAPVTDLVDMSSEDGQFSSREAVRRQVGDARDDRVQLLATSPRFHAAKIQVPVVLLHGTHDRNVDHRHSVWMAEALKAAGKPHEFISLDRGDHGLSHHAYRVRLFKALEVFLDRVLALA